MHKTHFGANFNEVLNSLLGSWLNDGPPVCFLEGFPGVGKSDIAARLVAGLPKQEGWHSIIEEVPARANPSVLDTFYDLADGLGRDGLPEMESILLGETQPNLAFALEKALRRRVLIVIDEAQRLFAPDSGQPASELAGVLAYLRNRPALPGRLLMLSDRLVERARWSEAFTIKTLTALSSSEALSLLDDRLTAANLPAAIPVERKPELVQALGCNPRAIETLVANLAYESLEEIIGRDPGLWAVQDREVSREFLEKLERNMLERTLEHLAPLQHSRLLMLSAHRKSFEAIAIELLCGGTRKEWRDFRNLLVTRFLLDIMV
jgi:hypothetical protein